MKKLLRFSLSLLISLPPFAALTQDITDGITYAQSDYDIILGGTSMHKVIGHDNSNYWVIKHFGNQFHLEKLDNDLNFIATEPLKMYEGLRTYDAEYFVHFYDELYVFMTRRGFSDITLYYQKIDKTTLKPSTGFIELTTIDFVRGNWADFHFSLSRNRTKLLVAARTKMQWSGVQFNEFYVFGKDLTPEWSAKDSYEYEGQGPRDNKYLVDDQGNVSILSLIKRESIMSLFREMRNLYTVYRYTDEGKTFREYPVTLNERYIRGLDIIAGPTGELICAGLYSEPFRSGMRGTFLFKIDPVTGSIYANVLHPFDDNLLGMLDELDEPTIKDEELIEYVVSDLVLRENGNIILIAEQFFEQNYDTYNNLVITCFDPYGSVYWSKVLTKNQDFNISTITAEIEPEQYRPFILETGALDIATRNLCSYALMAPVDESGIIIFYNDDVRNIGYENPVKNFNRPRKSCIMAARVDEFGNISKQALITWQRKGYFPEPLRYYDTLYDTIIIPAYRERKFTYFKITALF